MLRVRWTVEAMALRYNLRRHAAWTQRAIAERPVSQSHSGAGPRASRKRERDQELEELGGAEEGGQAPALGLVLVVSDRAVAWDWATHPARLQMLAIRHIYFSTPLPLRF
jgi:hypothetical protein